MRTDSSAAVARTWVSSQDGTLSLCLGLTGLRIEKCPLESDKPWGLGQSPSVTIPDYCLVDDSVSVILVLLAAETEDNMSSFFTYEDRLLLQKHLKEGI